MCFLDTTRVALADAALIETEDRHFTARERLFLRRSIWHYPFPEDGNQRMRRPKRSKESDHGIQLRDHLTLMQCNYLIRENT